MTTSTSLAVILAKTGLTDEQLRRAGVSVIGGDPPVSDSPQLLRAALDYAKRGWLVIPLHTPTAQGCSCGRVDCASPAKHPRTRNGSKDGSRDPDTIREWWRRWPDANVGIATGPEGGILVLDVDGAQGEQSLVDLAQRGHILPDTYAVRTGRGGQHLYFAWPEGVDVRNSARKIAPGLDIRGVGGLVAAPPSLHKSGRRYEVSESATDPAPCPEWLLSLIREANGTQVQQSAPAACAVEGERIPRGKGDPAKLKLAGSMFRSHQPFDVILAAIIALDRKCEHQRGEAECKRKVDEWAKRYTRGEYLTEAHELPERKPVIVRLSDVAAKSVSYLWEPFIAFAMLTLLSGDPGVGKSFVSLAIAAALTLGRLLDGRIVEPTNVLYFASAENSLSYSIRGRFDALGGDAARFFVLDGTVTSEGGEEIRGVITLADVPTIEKALIETKAKLVIIDPIQSFLGAETDMHRANEVRPLLDTLARLAEQYGCAVLMLRHLSKGVGGKGIYRGLGSIDFTAAARSELLAGQLPDDPEVRALCHQKNSVGRQGRSVGYAIDSQGKFSWTGESQVMAYDLLAAPEGPERSKRERAQEWLSALLKSGSREEQEIRSLAESEGFSYSTLRRAKDALRVKSHKGAFGGSWIWSQPEASPKDAPDPDEGRLTV